MFGMTLLLQLDQSMLALRLHALLDLFRTLSLLERFIPFNFILTAPKFASAKANSIAAIG
jgi:hypothetical protein